MPDSRRLLAVFGHPDDESFGVGGTLAKYAAEGAQVRLICATRGEVGEISDASLATPENLGAVREQELREACRIMDIGEPIFLGYRDSGMAGSADNEHPDCFHRADPAEAVGRLVRIMREFRPQVVLTFDETGAYGHPDHLAAHRFTLEAVRSVGSVRLYCTVLPREVIRSMAELARSQGIQIPEWFDPDRIGSPNAPDAALDVSKYLEIKRHAIAAHRTQQSPDGPFSQFPKEMVDAWLSTEHFRLYYGSAPPGVQQDLFAGL